MLGIGEFQNYGSNTHEQEEDAGHLKIVEYRIGLGSFSIFSVIGSSPFILTVLC